MRAVKQYLNRSRAATTTTPTAAANDGDDDAAVAHNSGFDDDDDDAGEAVSEMTATTITTNTIATEPTSRESPSRKQQQEQEQQQQQQRQSSQSENDHQNDNYNIIETNPQHDDDDDGVFDEKKDQLSPIAALSGSGRSPPAFASRVQAARFGEASASGANSNSAPYASSGAPTAPPTSGGGGGHNSSSCVKVAIRVRPLLGQEAGTDACIRVFGAPPAKAHRSANHPLPPHPCSVQIGGSSGPQFTFDQVFGPGTSQEELYQDQVAPLVQSCLEGYNATILAYGQTGSGKTYTIMGPPTSSSSSSGGGSTHGNLLTAGAIPRAITALFDALQGQISIKQQQNNRQTRSRSSVADEDDEEVVIDAQVRVQFLELYGEEIRDLLAPSSSSSGGSKLSIRDLGQTEPEVVGATQRQVHTAQEALTCLTHGMLRRVTGSTAMNATSSRSHAILSIWVEQSKTTVSKKNGKTTTSDNDAVMEVKRSKFSFVDLAGSERQKRTMASGKRLKEGIDINKGLLVLGNVISALGDPKKRGKTFVPYRDSKLTRLLKGSLGGNHKTLMIACVSPSSDNLEESLNCLRYANRAKNIQNNAIVNLDANSRLVAELQDKVQALAVEVLRAWDGQPPSPHLSRQLMESLAGSAMGHLPVTLSAPGPMVASTPPRASSAASTAWTPAVAATSSAMGTGPSEEKFEELQSELNKTREMLRESQRNHDMAEEQLYGAKAEKELYRLQMSVLTAQVEGDDDMEASLSPLNRTMEESAFVERAEKYEQEIARLRQDLRSAEAKISGLTLAMGEDDMSPHDVLGKDALILQRANKELNRERQRYLEIKQSVSEDSEYDPDAYSGVTASAGASSSAMDPKFSSNSTIEAAEEDKAEQAAFHALTSKYLGREDDDDDDQNDTDNEQQGNKEQQQGYDGPDDLPASGSEGLSSFDTRDTRVQAMKQQLIQADLMELSKSIAAKEELINQLKSSQEKYASMRHFYEAKLKAMEGALEEKEAERGQLMKELQDLKKSGASGAEIEARVREKEKAILELKRKQKDLKSLTSISSRNEAEISKLLEEVQTMKRRKADLQKQLTLERKKHAAEMKKLQKDAIQKERELNKWKRVSSQREAQAQKANSVAKTRLEELGVLRAKYKDSERRLRLQSVKRGVMEKAGLDSVIVGRRESKTDKSKGVQSLPKSSSEIDADALRDFFDQKVADIVRREALADKLAEEWEKHFELMSRKQELADSADKDEMEDALQTLKVQIRFKEDRIRQLARRLGKQRPAEGKGNIGAAKEDFLYDSDFKKIARGIDAESAKSVSARVLFGMIVRERRRVSTLAKTASALDERLQEAENAAAVHEAALRSFKEEQSRELAAMSSSQQEQVLSLMNMVKDASTGGSDADGDFSVNADVAPQMLVLAHERIALLEQQVEELEFGAQKSIDYSAQLDELTAALQTKAAEGEDLANELSELRASLRQIREATSRSDDLGLLRASILETVENALHPSDETTSPKEKRRYKPRDRSGEKLDRASRRRLKKHVELMHTSDSGDADEAPEWAGDIMADLALIAEGKMPPSLKDSPSVLAGTSQLESGTVFDRLADPQSFTGTQKHVQEMIRSPKSPALRTYEERAARTAEVSSRLDRIAMPAPRQLSRAQEQESSSFTGNDRETKGTPSKGQGGGDSDSSSQKNSRSVFDRLVSPSQYTGTQKEKFHGGRSRRGERTVDDTTAKAGTNASSGGGSVTDTKRTVYEDYTQQDVFERLQKTTTQAYAVKQNEPVQPAASSTHFSISSQASFNGDRIAREKSVGGGGSSVTDHSDSSIRRSGVYEDYTQQDVFERLTKTTTQAYAVKHAVDDNNRILSPHASSMTTTQQHSSFDDNRSRSSSTTTQTQPQNQRNEEVQGVFEKKVPSDYTSQDVFERLQRTTTEAYANKARRDE